MSDEKLRELERAFQESGSEEAELAWLRGRARAGEKLDWPSYSRLHELDVEVATGYLQRRVERGDLSQWRADLSIRCLSPQGSLISWANSLTGHDRRSLVGLSVLAAGLCLEAGELETGTSAEGLRRVLAHAYDWITEQGEESQRIAIAQAQAEAYFWADTREELCTTACVVAAASVLATSREHHVSVIEALANYVGEENAGSLQVPWRLGMWAFSGDALSRFDTLLPPNSRSVPLDS